MLSPPLDATSTWRPRWPSGLRLLLAWGALFLPAESATAQHIIFVDGAAIGARTGVSWTNAYADLQDALDEARAVAQAMPVEVWVAAGTYRADRGTGDRTMSFELASNVAIYGGFSGDEDCLEQRDWQAFETILSGDLLGDDNPAAPLGSTCCLADNVDECDNEACAETICALTDECEDPYGFAYVATVLCGDLCRPTFNDNTLHVVFATATDGSAVLDGFTVRAGEACTNWTEVEEWSRGAALWVRSGEAMIRNCTFVDNRGAIGGSVVYIADNYNKHVNFVNCRFLDWTAEFEHAPLDSGAVRINEGDATFEACAFLDKRSISIDAVFGPGAIVIRDCRFTNHTGIGPLLYIRGFDTVVDRCTFEGNDTGTIFTDGGYQLTDCVFRNNRNLGPLILGLDASMTVENSLFVGNELGVSVFESGALRLVNTTVAHNRILNTPTAIYYRSFVCDNSILWGNDSFVYPDEDEWNQFNERNHDEYLAISHSLVQGWTGDYGGEGNSGADPMFIAPGHWEDPAGTPDDWSDDIWVDGDYHLSPGSPAINGGDPSIDWHPWATDLDGHPQELCGEADIGAYEFGLGDADCDQAVTLYDSAYWESCLTGPPLDNDPWDEEPILSDACKALDFNADNHVDLSDFARYTLIVQD